MRRLKFLLVFVFLLVGTLTVMSFTNDKYRRSAAAWECFKYIGPQPLLTGQEIFNSNNWEPMLQQPFPTCMGGYELCAICYDSFTTTAIEARQTVYNYYRTFSAFPTNGSVIYSSSGKMVQVYTYFADIEE